MTIWNVAAVLSVNGGAQQILDGGGRMSGLFIVVRRPREIASGESRPVKPVKFFAVVRNFSQL